MPQRVKSLSILSTSRLPPRCIVVSIGCIHASFRSRLMRDLNNIRVTARGRLRKKVKGHFVLPIDERTGTKKGFIKHGDGDGEGRGLRRKKADELKNFRRSRRPIRFSMKLDRSRATFSFPLFRVFRDECARNAAAGTTPRRRCEKKTLYTVPFFIIHIHKVGSDIFRYACVYISVCIVFSPLLLVQ